MPTTVATAVTTLRERLDETTAAQWTDISLRRWLNEAIRDMARKTRHFKDTDTIAVTADDGEYTVASDVIHIYHVYYTPTGQTVMMPLEARAFEAMDSVWGGYQNQGGGYPAVWTTFGFAPSLTIKLFPVPSVAGSLTLHVARLPAALDVTSGTGNIEVPEAWLELAYDYAEYMALRKDRDPRWQESLQMYEQNIQQMIDMGEYQNAPGEFVWSGSGMQPAWLVDPSW